MAASELYLKVSRCFSRLFLQKGTEATKSVRNRVRIAAHQAEGLGGLIHLAIHWREQWVASAAAGLAQSKRVRGFPAKVARIQSSLPDVVFRTRH